MGLTLRIGAISFLLIALLSGSKPTFAQANIDLAVHYVEGVPINNEIAYDVNVYLSVVDGTGTPIVDLTTASLTVTEDSQKVNISGLALVDNEPINLVLVMDTSGSMSGTGIRDAKAAASNFVSGLKDKDQVALVTFDDTVQRRIDFTTDQKSVNDQIDQLDAKRGAGTCMFDAAYRAIQMVSTLPSGRRALILFTDGKDETASGKKCSKFTIDDVIGLASSGGTRTPIYTLSLGKLVDENSLKRLSELTGGHYLYSPDSSQLESTFQLLSSQLRSQYVLKYKSVSGPGAHILAVNVNYQNSQDSDTRNFLLPALLPQITFLTPLENDTVEDQIKAAISLSGQGATVNRVEFKINDTLAGIDDTTPYEVELNLDKYPIGNLNLSAIAYGSDNSELASKSITIQHGEALVAPPKSETEPPEESPATEANNLVVMVGGGIAALGLITILILVFVIVRQRSQEKESDARQRQESQSQPRQSYREPAVSRVETDQTMDSYGEESDALGALTIESSDDPTMIGHRFEITSSTITLGRSADNDINFPKDTPVSRRHAEIYERNGRLFLKEIETMDASGVYSAPKYGTFLNEVPLGSSETALSTGDEIQLGKRVRLKFEAYQKSDHEESLTYDDMTESDDPDKTQDSF